MSISFDDRSKPKAQVPSVSAMPDGLPRAPEGSSLHFLSHLWPPSRHNHAIAIRNPKTKAFRTVFVESPTEAAEIASRESSAGNDIYFPPASFQVTDNRKADNAAGACCFWMDIDVGEDKADSGSGYHTKERALTALICFCAAAEIPEPTHIVNSGGGLHVYWVLDRPIGRKLWLLLARKLKELARVLGFRADRSRTADIASLLRMPGSMNYKYSPPRPVDLISAADEPIKLCVMADAITVAYERLMPSEGSSRNASASHDEPADIPLLQEALLVLPPDMDYPDWFRVAAALVNHTGGSESAYTLFDQWSSGGTKYRGKKDTWRLWSSLDPDHPNPITIATLRMLVKAAGHCWPGDFACVADSSNDAEGEV